MTTDATAVTGLVQVSGTGAPPPQPNISNEHAALLDLAGILSLTRADADAIVVDGIQRMLEAYFDEIEAYGHARQARLGGDVAALEAEINERVRLRDELTRLTLKRAELRAARVELETTIARLDGELVRRRHEAEERQIAEQLATLRNEEEEAQRRAANRRTGDEMSAEDLAARRNQSIRHLEQKYDEVLSEARPQLEREQALAARGITQTVSGFLLWLGYGSVAATGTVLALMMNGGSDWQFGTLVDGWRAVMDSFGTVRAVWRVGLGVLTLAVLLALVGASIVGAEYFLKKRKGWNREPRSDREPQVNLTPQSITRRTYTQFLAILPFLFGAGIIATLLTVTPIPSSAPGQGNVLLSALPTLGYAFVGIVIAFLATAAFVMYVVRIVEPRLAPAEQRTSVLSTAWEFAVPPLVLIGAVAATPFLLKANSNATQVVASQWMPWAGFMLISSLSLACGIVYHGVFKDAKTARGRMKEVETQLDLERAQLAYDALPRDETITQEYGMKLRRLHDVQRDLRLGRLGLSVVGHSNAAEPDRWWHWLRPRRVGGPVSASSADLGPLTFRPIDYEVAGDVIGDLAKARAERNYIAAELEEVEQVIRRNAELSGFDALVPLIRLIERTRGDFDASPAEVEQQKRRAAITGEVLTLEARTVVSNGQAVRPFFEGVRAELAEQVPYVAIPAPEGDPQ